MKGPVNYEEILDMDATTLAKNIKSRNLSSELVVRTYISRLKSIQPVVNCLVEERFEQAIEEGKEADKKILAGKEGGRLFGVPISIKESFDVKHMKTTGGLISRKNHVAAADADIVKKLKAEGAIILGKTNTPTLCFCQETDNKLYGRTNNPFSPDRTAGGSSGGEGALIAAGGAAVGIGSDIGGSIRFPSHFNGTVGFKSGSHQVPETGSFPSFRNSLQEQMLGIGAIAKSVQDAELIHSIIAKHEPPNRDLGDFSVVVPFDHLPFPADSPTKQALRQVKDILSSDMVVLDEEPPYFRESARLWQFIMSIDGGEHIARIAFEGKPGRPLREFLKERLFKRSEFHHYFTWALFGAKLFKPKGEQIKEMEERIVTGKRAIQSYLENRLLILPVYHTTAMPHGKVYRELFSVFKSFLTYIPFVAYANTWGLPSLTLPVSEDALKLPIGLQVISAIGNEQAIFQLGKGLERKTRGYKRAMKELE